MNMKNYIYLFTIFLVVAAFAVQQQEMRQMRHIISDQKKDIFDQQQELFSLQARQNQHEEHIKLALHLGRNTQKTLYDSRSVRVVKVTAYSPRQEETDSTPDITAANTKVRPGIVAVSRDLFDKGWIFGKKVYIKSLGIFTIEDLMAKRKTNQIDIFMPDTTAALAFGRQNLEAYLLATPPPKEATYTRLYTSPSPNFILAAEDICPKKYISTSLNP